MNEISVTNDGMTGRFYTCTMYMYIVYNMIITNGYALFCTILFYTYMAIVPLIRSCILCIAYIPILITLIRYIIKLITTFPHMVYQVYHTINTSYMSLKVKIFLYSIAWFIQLIILICFIIILSLIYIICIPIYNIIESYLCCYDAENYTHILKTYIISDLCNIYTYVYDIYCNDIIKYIKKKISFNDKLNEVIVNI